MAGKVIQHPASFLKKKYGDITDKIEKIDEELETNTQNYLSEFIDHHKSMYEHGLGQAKSLFKDKYDKATVEENEDKAKQVVTDMILKYEELAHSFEHGHFKKETENMKLDDKYNFAINIYNMHHGSDGKKGGIGDIVAQYKKKGEKGTIKAMMNELGVSQGQHAVEAANYKASNEAQEKYLELEKKNRDDMIHLAKHAAVNNNYDIDGTGKFHLHVLQEGGAIGAYKSIMGGKLDEKAEKELGIKKLKPSSKPKILGDYYEDNYKQAA